MATFRLEFDAAGEPILIEEGNGNCKTPVNDFPLPSGRWREDEAEALTPRPQRAA